MDFLNPSFVITSIMKIHVAHIYEENACVFADFVVRVMIRDADTDADGDYRKRSAGSGKPYHRMIWKTLMIWIS